MNLRYNFSAFEETLVKLKGTTLVKLRYNFSDVKVQP